MTDKQKKDAAERVKKWQRLSPQEQLDYINKYLPDGANKQRAKILKKISANKEKDAKKNNKISSKSL